MSGESPWKNMDEALLYVKRPGGKRFLRKEVQAGRLRAAKIGGRRELLFRREWLDEWIEDQATPVIVPVRRRA